MSVFLRYAEVTGEATDDGPEAVDPTENGLTANVIGLAIDPSGDDAAATYPVGGSPAGDDAPIVDDYSFF
ncbi:MAG: hypothetical protein AAF074_18480 [Pseudomonadota bacterium]